METFYQQQQFELAWKDQTNRDSLLAAIAASPGDGLNPQDFHFDVIEQLSNQLAVDPSDQAVLADLDIVLTDALVRLGYQLFYGKIHPERLDADWNFMRPLLARDPVQAAASALRPGALGPFLDSLRPDHPYYLTLKAALRSYREIETTGGWPTVPEGPSLNPGMISARVGALRQRLAASGHYDGTGTSNPELYDQSLAAAVRDFQGRHGLSVDGVVGPATLSKLASTKYVPIWSGRDGFFEASARTSSSSISRASMCGWYSKATPCGRHGPSSGNPIARPRYSPRI
jgi:murein L,D-transpeptidase YcbB/YkuD